MSQAWDSTLNAIVKKNADKWGLPTDQAKEIIECYVAQNMKAMRRLELVHWINLGKFFISSEKTREWLLAIFGKLHVHTYKRTTDKSRGEVKELLEKYIHLRKISQEHDYRTGKGYRYQQIFNQKVAEGIPLREIFKKKTFATIRHERQVSRDSSNSADIQPIQGQP